LGLTGIACLGVGACSSSPGDDDDSDSGLPGEEDSGVPDNWSQPDVNRPDRGVDTGRDAPTHSDASDGASEGGKDGGKDSSKDADAALPPTGSECTPVGTIQSKRCGTCGTQARLCIASKGGDAGSTDAGPTGVWDEWGDCIGELVGGCTPGEVNDASACGKCGTQTRTCQNNCTWKDTTKCANEGACWPGQEEFYPGVSCVAGKGQERSCTATCDWGSGWSGCKDPDPALVISSDVDGYVSNTFQLSVGPSFIPKWGGAPDCRWSGSGDWKSSSSLIRGVIEVQNPTGQDAVVSIWSGAATGGVSNATMLMAAFEFPPNPADINDLTSCWPGFRDQCNDTTAHPTACSSGWPGLMKNDDEDFSVYIPANGSVYVLMLDVNDAAAHIAADYKTGMVYLSAKSIAFSP
jgi:hypothetical protein